jgi:homoserine O-succinyltransferase
MPIKLSRDFPAPRNGDAGTYLDIGLVNNMPGKALQATESQFRSLLESAAQDVTVRLWLFALPDVPRTDSGRQHIDSMYSSLDDLWHRQLDGIIVTGMEPRAANLRDEPYWPHMQRLVSWAEQNTSSTVWSCLAAHAAVLQLDGIKRRRLAQKRFGLFEYDRVSEHPLTAGMSSPVTVPHSRWNDLAEDELVAAGYRVLTRAENGVDAFVKQRQSLFVFLQGHPEYEAQTLLLEYIRDIGRFLRSETDVYPPIPHRYFDSPAAEAMASLEKRAATDRREELLSDFPTHLTANLANTWRASATCLYGNWIKYLSARKQQRSPLLMKKPPDYFAPVSAFKYR